MSRVEALEAEIDRLRGQIAELTASDRGAQLRAVLRLSPQESQLLALIEAKGRASRAAIYGSVFEDCHGDGPVMKAIDVVICKIRRKLREQGAPGQIKCVRHWGFELSSDLSAWLTDLTAPRVAVAA